MFNSNNVHTIEIEKRKATIWFVWLFFITFFFYEIVYFNVVNYLTNNYNFSMRRSTFSFFLYAVIFLLVPVIYYSFKVNKYQKIKYILFYVYTIGNIISEFLYYTGNNEPYASGNILEIVMILFAPIFVNVRFFYTVSLGTLLKYIIVGLLLLEPIVVLPMILVLVVSVVGSIILYRFLAYVKAVGNSYDKQLEGIVKGIVTTLELKDNYTRGHSERVAEYALILAKSLNIFNEADLKVFYNVCLLHDVGKVSIPDEILLKKDRLTDDEFNIIKKHPTIGADVIQDVEGVTDYIEVIRHHHERWDGNGYPDNLKGEQISLFARITSIADAFDAMTSSRSYREALSLEVARKRIIEGSGTQFDPILVKQFEKVYPLWVDFNNNYKLKRGENNENS
jgi:putative nucleotidyltransferase with HDIG domain